jgi:hypothetical protein
VSLPRSRFRISPKSLRAIACLGLVSTLALGSCAKSNERVVEVQQTPAEVLQATAERTQAAGTFKTAGELAVQTGPDGGFSFSMPISGAVDKKGNRTSVTIDMGPMMRSFGDFEFQAESELGTEGDADSTVAVPSSTPSTPSTASPDATNNTLDVRSMNGTLYLTMGALGDSIGLPNGKWVQLDAKALGLTEADLADLTGSGGASPELGLQYLESVNAAGVAVVGTDQVRGEDTTKYTATVDVEALLQRGSSAIAKKQRADFEKLGVAKTVPITVWIDTEGRTRKMTYEIGVNGPDSIAQGTKSIITMEFYDFGKPVDISVPDPSKTLTLDQVPKYKEAIEAQTKG